MTAFENNFDANPSAAQLDDAADASSNVTLDDSLLHETFDNAAQDDAAINGFEALHLNPALIKAVDALGYTAPTPVQAQTIPASLEGGDWMVSSQTGSGKTAAFLLPALHALLASPPMSKGEQAARGRRAAASPRVLVLAPTRELAQQVAQEAISLVRFCKGIRIANVVGGTAFGKQLMDLRGATLVVATPGRLLDLNRNGQLDLNAVQTLVVDEADRMLDLGFSEDLEAIHVATSKRDRTLMFSATFAPRIMELASHVMRAPQRIELATAQDSHENIDQRLHWFDDMAHKNVLLEHYLADESMVQAVVFTATQIEADELADELRDAGYAASALHGAMPQALRNRRIKSLREGNLKILVATDVAARGIDVPTISHVINYGLPMKPEDYVHRIGRTGRAGRNGVAVTLAGARDRYRIRNIEMYTQRRLNVAVVEGHEPQTNPQMGNKFGPRRGGSHGGAPRAERSFDRGNNFRSAEREGGFDRGARFGGGNASADFQANEPRREQRFGDARPPRGSREFGAKPAFGAERSASPYSQRPAFESRAPRAEFAPRRDFEQRREFEPRGERRADTRDHFDNAPRAYRDEAPRAFRDDAARSHRDDATRGFRDESHPRSARAPHADRFHNNDAPRFGRQPAGERSFDRGNARSFDAGHAPMQREPRDHRGSADARRDSKQPGPALTPPAPGGNRAARRAHLQAEFAARAAAGEA